MKEFVMRGQTASGLTHTINFSGHKGDYGFRLIEFSIYPSSGIGSTEVELSASITAGKNAVDPTVPNFDDEGLIGTALWNNYYTTAYLPGPGHVVINDTFLITQDIILMVQDTTSETPINWQCKFFPVKLSSTEAALTNYRQFSIFDE